MKSPFFLFSRPLVISCLLAVNIAPALLRASGEEDVEEITQALSEVLGVTGGGVELSGGSIKEIELSSRKQAPLTATSSSSRVPVGAMPEGAFASQQPLQDENLGARKGIEDFLDPRLQQTLTEIFQRSPDQQELFQEFIVNFNKTLPSEALLKEKISDIMSELRITMQRREQAEEEKLLRPWLLILEEGNRANLSQKSQLTFKKPSTQKKKEQFQSQQDNWNKAQQYIEEYYIRKNTQLQAKQEYASQNPTQAAAHDWQALLQEATSQLRIIKLESARFLREAKDTAVSARSARARALSQVNEASRLGETDSPNEKLAWEANNNESMATIRETLIQQVITQAQKAYDQLKAKG